MNNKTYDIIKKVALLVAPAVTFMTAVVDIWGIPYGQQIVATCAALDTFIGVAVTILASNYQKNLKSVEEGDPDA
ncbi:MAG: phage holin [Saccharofermentans sp.]|jgi:hypothetical protein|nr:phage holin [Saccharofermentans sp.]